ncbi:hypothetical protein W97_05161 [Coniosporium apollinis CBS 100218]|uniref:Uncharacterized protein n=1 Tax=Coniosporium apollinis (strain CBS 100218) TaxID=1168221 RepID=R7YVS9_CONA1|nr:uncharacterized protein W97_05161 [Coniosporium apollinis CBS 100218]EON65919.1 hypothetical protein W97_05161 [Coniosporium apollinis CBS 100218]
MLSCRIVRLAFSAVSLIRTGHVELRRQPRSQRFGHTVDKSLESADQGAEDDDQILKNQYGTNHRKKIYQCHFVERTLSLNISTPSELYAEQDGYLRTSHSPERYAKPRLEIEQTVKSHNRLLIGTVTSIRGLPNGRQEDQSTIGDLNAKRGKNSQTTHLPITIDFQLQSILPIFRIKVQDRSRYEEALLVDPDDCEHVLFWWPGGDGSGVVRLDTKLQLLKAGQRVEKSLQKFVDYGGDEMLRLVDLHVAAYTMTEVFVPSHEDQD